MFRLLTGLILLGSMHLSALCAQEERLHLVYNFAFDPHPDPRAEVVNETLKTIAAGSGKLRVFTSYGLQGSIIVRLEESDGVVSYTLHPGDFSLSGDIYYRDFSLEHVLMPDLADLKIDFVNQDGGTIYTANIQRLELGAEPEAWPVGLFMLESHSGAIGVRLQASVFYYDQRMAERMHRWDRALATYYDAPIQFARINELLEGIDVRNPETLLLDEFRLCEAESMIGGLRYAPFHHWLGLHERDPEQVMPVLKQLQKRIDSLRLGFNHAIMHIDSLFYEQGKMAALEGSADKARELFHSAIVYNPFHIPAHLSIVMADMDLEDLRPALSRLGEVLAVMHPVGRVSDQAAHLADSVLSLFFEESTTLISEDRLTESLEVLTYLEGFTGKTEGFYPRPPMLDELLAKTHQGIYRSFIVVSERALNNNDLVFAKKYLESAVEYQQMHPSYVPDHDSALKYLFSILVEFRKRAEQIRVEYGPDSAITYVEQARTIGSKYPGLVNFLIRHGEGVWLDEGAISYAFIGLPHRSLESLSALRDMNRSSDYLEVLQRGAGYMTALYFKYHQSETLCPERFLEDLTAGDPWLDPFRQSFLESW